MILLWFSLLAILVCGCHGWVSSRLQVRHRIGRRIVQVPMAADDLQAKSNEVDLYNKYVSYPQPTVDEYGEDQENGGSVEHDGPEYKYVPGSNNNEEYTAESLKSLAGRLYDGMFFYGLDTPSLKSDVGELGSDPEFKKEALRAQGQSKPSPFLTPSEQRALHVLDVAKKRSAKRKKEGLSSPIPTENKVPYDPADKESVRKYVERLQTYIAKLERELSLAQVNLAADEGEQRAALTAQVENLSGRLDNAKVELVTVEVANDPAS